jgi:hypothetical protein
MPETRTRLFLQGDEFNESQTRFHQAQSGGGSPVSLNDSLKREDLVTLLICHGLPPLFSH